MCIKKSICKGRYLKCASIGPCSCAVMEQLQNPCPLFANSRTQQVIAPSKSLYKLKWTSISQVFKAQIRNWNLLDEYAARSV